MIYLDNAATTKQKPKETIEGVLEGLNSMGNAGRGASEASLDASRIIFDTRRMLCELFHGEHPRQIVFTSNSTESLNLALKGLLGAGDHVITTVLEHNSVLRPLYELEKTGVELTILPCDAFGNFEVSQVEGAIRSNTKLIVSTHGSNLTGNLVDIAEIGKISQKRGIVFVVDASQTAGIFPIDVKDMGIDVLCFTGHKGLLGPQGVGGLYVREGVKIRPLKVGGSGVQTFSREHPKEMPTVLEAGTLNGHGVSGLRGALSYLRKVGIHQIREKEQSLMKRFYEGVRSVPKVKLYGDFSTWERCPIVSLNLGEYDSGEVSDALALDYGIVTRSGGHCAPLMHESFGTKEQGCVRFSFSHYNTEEEVDLAVRAIRNLAREEE